jgi:hypothetical protein
MLPAMSRRLSMQFGFLMVNWMVVQIRQEMAWLHQISLGTKIGMEDFLGTNV